MRSAFKKVWQLSRKYL